MAVTHLSVTRINAFGGTTYTTACNRMTQTEINCTTNAAKVTCKLCQKRIAR